MNSFRLLKVGLAKLRILRDDQCEIRGYGKICNLSSVQTQDLAAICRLMGPILAIINL